VDIVSFTTDPALLGLSLSPAQETLQRVIYGLELTPEQFDLYRECTGRVAYEQGHPFRYISVLAGARSGKDSRLALPMTLYEATTWDAQEHPDVLHGEPLVIPLVAPTERSTQVLFSYILGRLAKSPLLADVVDDDGTRKIVLKNGLSIECFPCTRASLQGWSIPFSVMDECAFFRLEGSVDSDKEIETAIRRGMHSLPSAKLLKISVPYIKGGILYDDYKQHWAGTGYDVLVWKAPTWLMVPSDGAAIERERRTLDPDTFTRLYSGDFVDALTAFLSPECVDAAVRSEPLELPRIRRYRYVAGYDGSGGRGDAKTLAICHVEGTRLIVDGVWAWKGDNPEQELLEAVDILTRYGIRQIFGDQYGGALTSAPFRTRGIAYISQWRPAVRSGFVQFTKSGIYAAFKPLMLSGRVELPDHQVLLKEIKQLEQTNRSGGAPSIDHPKGDSYHDDYINSVAIACVFAERFRMAAVEQHERDTKDYPFGDEPWRPGAREEEERLERVQGEIPGLADKARLIYAKDSAVLTMIDEAAAVDDPDVAVAWFRDLFYKLRPDTNRDRLERAGLRD